MVSLGTQGGIVMMADAATTASAAMVTPRAIQGGLVVVEDRGELHSRGTVIKTRRMIAGIKPVGTRTTPTRIKDIAAMSQGCDLRAA